MLLFILLLSPSFAFSQNSTCVGAQAILVSGQTDSCDFLHDLESMNYILQPSFPCIQILEGMGPTDIARNAAALCKEPSFADDSLPPSAPNISQGTLAIHGSGSLASLQLLVDSTIKNVKPNTPFIFYFTDHGLTDGQVPRISMDNGKDITPDDLRKILQRLPPEEPAMLLHDHCFSAGMLAALFDEKTGRPRRGSCGAAAAETSEYSYNGESLAYMGTLLSARPKLAALVERDRDGKISLQEMIQLHRSLPTYAAKGKLSVRSAAVLSSTYFLEQYRLRHPLPCDDARDQKTCSASGTILDIPQTATISQSEKIAVAARQKDLDSELHAHASKCRLSSEKNLEKLRTGIQEQMMAALSDYLGSLKNSISLFREFVDTAHPGWREGSRGIYKQRDFLELYLQDAFGTCGLDPAFSCCTGKEAVLRVNYQVWDAKPQDLPCTKNGLEKLTTLTLDRDHLADELSKSYNKVHKQEVRQRQKLKNKIDKLANQSRACRMVAALTQEQENLNFLLERNEREALDDYFNLVVCEQHPLFEIGNKP